MKRQKTVYPTSEIAHLWAHQTQPEARNAQGNFYFDGDTIYSYGSHFPIARHVTNKRGQHAVLFVDHGYSSTTAKHINDVRQSIPHDIPVFEVGDVRGDLKRIYAAKLKDVNERIEKLRLAHPSNKYEYKVKTSKRKLTIKQSSGIPIDIDVIAGKHLCINRSDNVRRSGSTTIDLWNVTILEGEHAGVGIASGLTRTEARIMLDVLDSTPIKTWDVSTPEARKRAFNKVTKARDVAARYGNVQRNPGTLAKAYRELRDKLDRLNRFASFFDLGPHKEFPIELDYLAAIEVKHAQRLVAASETRTNNRRARYAKQDADAKAKFEERLPRWLAGEDIWLGYDDTGTDYLRVKSDTVETSRGARVPLSHVQKALPVVMALIRNGRTYQRNGHTIRLGHYTIDSIDEQGNLSAGCHLFSKSEVERFAAIVEALPVAPDVQDEHAESAGEPVAEEIAR